MHVTSLIITCNNIGILTFNRCQDMASCVMQEVFVSPAVLEEVKRIIEDSEVGPV